ncbi:MAG: hypothetical protein UU76_C0018G0004 [Parcubacteria group bacterium GW2011_GWC1_41_7]|nr:MAG: hypothetical protein UU76_C0018G0004 [Parcubacteria group bacterium GW2011_GWC1_41_7]
MEAKESLTFKTAYGKKLEETELISEIKQFIAADEKFSYKVLVGTDSERHHEYVDFVSVIVVHRVGMGARYFWRRTLLKEKMEMQRRLWQEALDSLEVSRELLKLLVEIKDSFSFEMHIDVGKNGKSQTVMSEIANLVRGYGVAFKFKPDAYAASTIADRLI